MKKQLLILAIGLAFCACSSNKKTVTTTFDPDNNPYYVKKDKKEQNEVNDPKIQGKINNIIERHLRVSISSIAISPITKTPSGYTWKFMNVKNGSSFTGSSDLNFGSVEIRKKKKEQNTRISDF